MIWHERGIAVFSIFIYISVEFFPTRVYIYVMIGKNNRMISGRGIMDAEEILTLIQKQSFDQIEVFDVGLLSFQEDVRDMCRMNSCGRYGKTWNCPPHAGSLEELSGICRKYNSGILFNMVSKLDDSFDWEGMVRAGAAICDAVAKVNALIREDARLTDYRLFGSGACYNCEKCTYPDAPCRYPDKLFLPIEACGINVMELAKNAGLRYINGVNTVTFFGMLLYNSDT
jgi:predicted metal-binding protein